MIVNGGVRAGLTIVERYGVLGLLAVVVLWNGNRMVAALDANTQAVREMVDAVSEQLRVTAKAHLEYSEARDRAVQEVLRAIEKK